MLLLSFCWQVLWHAHVCYVLDITSDTLQSSSNGPNSKHTLGFHANLVWINEVSNFDSRKCAVFLRYRCTTKTMGGFEVRISRWQAKATHTLPKHSRRSRDWWRFLHRHACLSLLSSTYWLDVHMYILCAYVHITEWRTLPTVGNLSFKVTAHAFRTVKAWRVRSTHPWSQKCICS